MGEGRQLNGGERSGLAHFGLIGTDLTLVAVIHQKNKNEDVVSAKAGARLLTVMRINDQFIEHALPPAVR